MKLTLFYRKNLNMTRGKITSQCAHAVVSLYLSLIDFDTKQYRHPDVVSRFCDCDIELVPVDDATFDEKSTTALTHIIDAGRTMFGGVPTATVCLHADIDWKPWMVHRPYTVEDKIQTKQTILVDRTLKDKKQLSLDGIQASLKSIMWCVEEVQKGVSMPAFEHWWTHAFAKITLQLKEGETIPDGLIQHGHAYASAPEFENDRLHYQSFSLF